MAGDPVRTEFTLIIGNKNLSSWSLRPWFLMKAFDIPFREIVIRLDRPETRQSILAHSPSGLVPCLRHGDMAIWDSLAIAEYLADLYPEKKLWPADQRARALARSVPWAVSVSAIWAPTGKTGLRWLNGSWKIMEIRLPLI